MNNHHNQYAYPDYGNILPECGFAYFNYGIPYPTQDIMDNFIVHKSNRSIRLLERNNIMKYAILVSEINFNEISSRLSEALHSGICEKIKSSSAINTKTISANDIIWGRFSDYDMCCPYCEKHMYRIIVNCRKLCYCGQHMDDIEITYPSTYNQFIKDTVILDEFRPYTISILDVDMHLDHIVPKSRGGTNMPTNMIMACGDCNREKGMLTAKEYGFPEIQALSDDLCLVPLSEVRKAKKAKENNP